MDRKDDYSFFLKENAELIGELKGHVTMTYDLFHPVFLVLDYFKDKDMVVADLSAKEAEDLFSSGYYYLYNSVDLIKSILEKNFAMDIEEMIRYDKNVYLILRTDEIDSMTNGENPLFSSVIDQLYLMLEKRQPIGEGMLESIEDKLDEALSDTEETPMSDFFADIAEAIGLDLI